MGSLTDKLTHLIDTKAKIKSAIANKGVSMSDDTTFRQYADKINSIETSRYGAKLNSFFSNLSSKGELNTPTFLGDIDLTGVTTINDNALAYKFYNIKVTGTFKAPDLENIKSDGMKGTFYKCSGLTSAEFPKLVNVVNGGLSYTFSGCTKLTRLDFPMLVFPGTTAFGANPDEYTFKDCTNLLELHFRKDAQKYIESITGYSDKWGASNATIYFDL